MSDVMFVFVGLMVILALIAIALWRLDRADAGAASQPGARGARL